MYGTSAPSLERVLFLYAIVLISTLLIRSSSQNPGLFSPDQRDPGGVDAPNLWSETPAPSHFLRSRSVAYYQVRAHDTLGAIAVRAGISLARLLETNPGLAGRPLDLNIGTRVVIPLD